MIDTIGAVDAYILLNDGWTNCLHGYLLDILVYGCCKFFIFLRFSSSNTCCILFIRLRSEFANFTFKNIAATVSLPKYCFNFIFCVFNYFYI